MRCIHKSIVCIFLIASTAIAKEAQPTSNVSMRWLPYNQWFASFSYQPTQTFQSSVADLFADTNEAQSISFTPRYRADLFSVSYPQLPDATFLENKKTVSTFLDNWQKFSESTYVPKDLIPYLGIRMNYNITNRFSLFNDITTQSVVYGFQLKY